MTPNRESFRRLTWASAFLAVAAGATVAACRSAEQASLADKAENANTASPSAEKQGAVPATPPGAMAAAVPDPAAAPKNAPPPAAETEEPGTLPTDLGKPAASGESARAVTQTSPPPLPQGCRGLAGKVAFAAAQGSKCDAARCASLAGQCGAAGLGCSEACIYKATDSGKPCTDQSECQGDCLVDKAAPRGQAVKGQCSSLKATPGCLNRARKGVASGVVCVD